MAANDPARRLRVRIESLVNHGREICPAFFNFNGDDSCERCGYTDDVHLMRDLLKEAAAPPEGITALLEQIERSLALIDGVAYLVNLNELTNMPAGKHGGIACVVDRSEAMHALLFVRSKARELAAALRPVGETDGR